MTYMTGGKVPAKGVAAHGGNAASSTVDVTYKGAGKGTGATLLQDGSGPGGHGSSGTASDSK